MHAAAVGTLYTNVAVVAVSTQLRKEILRILRDSLRLPNLQGVVLLLEDLLAIGRHSEGIITKSNPVKSLFVWLVKLYVDWIHIV